LLVVVEVDNRLVVEEALVDLELVLVFP